VIENPLMRDAHSPSHQSVGQTERGNRTDAVDWHVKARARRWPGWRPVDGFCAEPAREESRAKRRPAMPAPTIKIRASCTGNSRTGRIIYGWRSARSRRTQCATREAVRASAKLPTEETVAKMGNFRHNRLECVRQPTRAATRSPSAPRGNAAGHVTAEEESDGWEVDGLFAAEQIKLIFNSV
jgi:hypothetical protein